MIRRHRCSIKRTINILGLVSLVWLAWYYIVRPFTDQESTESTDVKHSMIRNNVAVEMSAVSRQTHSVSSNISEGLKLLTQENVITVNISMTELEAENNFHEYVSQTQVVCRDRVRVGNVSDGGWDVCVAHPYQLVKPCLVYSFGIGDNWSFDDEMATKYGCAVRSFDPNIHRKDHVRNNNIYFYNIGIGREDVYNVTTGWTLKTLKSLIVMCHDEEMTIDYLKLDVEGSEWAALEVMLNDNSLVYVKQLAIEIHTRELDEQKSSISDIYRYWNILHQLEMSGFRKWYWHFNTWGFFPNRDSSRYISCCYELVFINTKYL